MNYFCITNFKHRHSNPGTIPAPAPQNTQHFMLVEAGQALCPNGLLSLQYLVRKAYRRGPLQRRLPGLDAPLGAGRRAGTPDGDPLRKMGRQPRQGWMDGADSGTGRPGSREERTACRLT